MGFEPTLGLLLSLISSQVPSTTQPPFPPWKTIITPSWVSGQMFIQRSVPVTKFHPVFLGVLFDPTLVFFVSLTFLSVCWRTIPPIKRPKLAFRPFKKDLAATYSRGSYTTTTIGKTAFDGRVRNGNGSDRSFIATKKCDGCRVTGDAKFRVRCHSLHSKIKELPKGFLVTLNTSLVTRFGISLKTTHRTQGYNP